MMMRLYLRTGSHRYNRTPQRSVSARGDASIIDLQHSLSIEHRHGDIRPAARGSRAFDAWIVAAVPHHHRIVDEFELHCPVGAHFFIQKERGVTRDLYIA